MNNDHDLQQQMARDLRFLAYRAGKPTPLMLALVVLIIGLFGFFFFAAFIGEIASLVLGPATHHHQGVTR